MRMAMPSKKTLSITVLVILIAAAGAAVVFSKSGTHNDKPLPGSNNESREFTSKRILAIISDTQWREGHIQREINPTKWPKEKIFIIMVQLEL